MFILFSFVVVLLCFVSNCVCFCEASHLTVKPYGVSHKTFFTSPEVANNHWIRLPPKSEVSTQSSSMASSEWTELYKSKCFI